MLRHEDIDVFDAPRSILWWHPLDDGERNIRENANNRVPNLDSFTMIPSLEIVPHYDTLGFRLWHEGSYASPRLVM